MKKLSLGTRLYLTIASLFIIFAIGSIFVQQYGEKRYRQSLIDEQLQAYNNHLTNSINLEQPIDETSLDNYVDNYEIDSLRLTIINLEGEVIYDNINKNYRAMGNHLDRYEVSQAIKTGHGTVTDRVSSSTNADYFYSATYFPERKMVVRSALPYDDYLKTQLSTGLMYVWFIVIVLIILMIVLKWFVNRVVSRLEHQKALERLQVRRELTQNIAHELKTPITGIMAYLETIITQDNLSPELEKQFLNKSLKQTQLLADLVRDISIINRIDYRPDVYSIEEVDLSDVINSALSDTSLMLEQHGIQCRNNALPALIQGNRMLLYSIFRNLIDNSIQYAGDGSIIEIGNEDCGDCIKFTFADNGNGVPDDSIKYLFDRFYRVDKGRERSLGSTGLGLSIVKNAVIFHGGYIEVKNRNGGGLTFTFTLKKHNENAAPKD